MTDIDFEAHPSIDPLMTIAESLEQFGHFHDWYLDTVTVGPNEPRTLTLGLYLGNRRATLTFEGVTCVCLENWGLLNIVYSIRLLRPDDERFAQARTVLARGERLTDRRAASLVYLYATLGAEIAIELDSIRIDPA
ncbi:hypothetical protein [Burkholderia sp. 3C]